MFAFETLTSPDTSVSKSVSIFSVLLPSAVSAARTSVSEPVIFVTALASTVTLVLPSIVAKSAAVTVPAATVIVIASAAAVLRPVKAFAVPLILAVIVPVVAALIRFNLATVKVPALTVTSTPPSPSLLASPFVTAAKAVESPSSASLSILAMLSVIVPAKST